MSKQTLYILIFLFIELSIVNLRQAFCKMDTKFSTVFSKNYTHGIYYWNRMFLDIF